MAKKVGDTKAVLIYGPYPDKRVISKVAFRVKDNHTGFDKMIPVLGLNTSALAKAIMNCLRKRMVRKVFAGVPKKTRPAQTP